MVIPDKYTQEAINKMERQRYEDYEWQLKRSIKPRRCAITKEKIPCLALAYRGHKISNVTGYEFLSEI